MFCLLVVLIFISSSGYAGTIYEIPINEVDYTVETIDGFARLRMSGAFAPFAPGAPELPAVAFTYLLPQKKKLAQVEIIEAQWEKIPGSFYIYPKQHEIVISDEREFVGPEKSIYNADNIFPPKIIISVHSGNARGYQLGQIGIVPFRYFPKSRELHRLKKLIISCELEDCEPGVLPTRQTRLAQEAAEQFLSQVVVNHRALGDLDKKPVFYIEDNVGDLSPTDLPSLLGPPVDLLIITTNTQFDGYTDLAHFKKITGYNTAVRTITWVRQHYTGVDDAERIRKFIADAVANWGVLYVLMGGDVLDIPTRWVWTAPLYSQWPVHIVTDHYYSDLDGNWNGDGDEKYGEVDDSLDLFPDVFVGRLPTTNNIQVRDYIDKLKAYLFPDSTDYQTKALFFTSDFDVSNDAYEMALRLADHLPSYFTKSIIDERPRAELKDSIHSGFGLIFGLGHGDINNIRVKNNPRENATNYFFDSLANTDYYALMLVITCYTNTFQADCLSKHWLLNPQGGGIVYIGPTSFSEAYLHEEYTAVLIDSLLVCPVAAALAKSKIPYVSQAQWDNWHRLYQFSIALLGDPTLTLWDSIPLFYDSVSLSPDTICVGVDSVSVSVVPDMAFDVVFYKAGECFVRESVSGGVLTVGVRTESAGYLKYAVMAKGYIMHIDSVCVVPVEPYVVFSSCQVIDTLGNSNGVVNPGEGVYLDLGLVNTGGVIAESVYVELVCSDSLVQVNIDSAFYGDIGVGVIGYNVTPLYFDVSGSMPDEYSLDFEVAVGYLGGSSVDSFQLIGLASSLGHFGQAYSVFGDTVEVLPYLVNYGHSLSDSVYGVVSGVSGGVLLDSVVNFPLVVAGGVVSSQPDYFRVVVDSVGCEVSYQYRVYEGGVGVIDYAVVLGPPSAVCSLRVLGRREAVSLEWLPDESASGYRVYRGLSLSGQYSLLSSYLGVVSSYEDYTVQPGVDYYYYVVAYDSSMNISIPSDTVCGKTNPLLAPGWPQRVYDFLFSSPNFADIDPFYPGLEIVVCGKEGYVYAWHYDGTPVIGDGVLFDIHPAEVWTSPAIGDVNNDGLYEIVFGVRRATNNLYLINNQGVCLPGWPKSVSGMMIGSPVLADIDEDDSLEIFIWTLYSDIYAFHHDGTGVYSADGLLKNMPGIAFGTLAIGDINRDGDMEIVCCGGSGSDSLFVWDRHGNYLAPFPIYIQSGGLPYSAVLGDVLGDERLEICFYADNTEGVYLVDVDGSIKWFNPIGDVADIEGSPVIADITGDGKPEIICSYKSGFTVLDSLGHTLAGFPDITHDAKLPVVGDVDGDSDFEVILGSSDWNLYAYENNGTQASGFPIQFGNRIDASPAIFDIDWDGRLELMTGGNDYTFSVFDLETAAIEWPKFRYDIYNTGTYRSGFLPGILDINRLSSINNPYIKVMPSIFTDYTSIIFSPIQGSKNYKIKIYDVTGRLIRQFDYPTIRLSNQVTWIGDDDLGRNVSAGVYFVTLEQAETRTTKKIIKIQ